MKKISSILIISISIMLIPGTLLGEQFHLVPEDLVQEIVLDEVKQVFGDAQIFNVTTYYDVDGNPEVYCFTLYRKSDPIPDYDEVIETIEEGYEEKKKLQQQSKNTTKKEEKKNLKKQISIIQNTQILRKSEFITVFAAANEGHQPIIKMHAGLPPHLTQKEESKHMALDMGGKPNIRFRRAIYFDMMTIGLEFADTIANTQTSSEVHTQKNISEEDNIIIFPHKKKRMRLKEVKEKLLLKKQEMILDDQQKEVKKRKSEKLETKWKRLKRNYDQKKKRSEAVTTESKKSPEPVEPSFQLIKKSK